MLIWMQFVISSIFLNGFCAKTHFSLTELTKISLKSLSTHLVSLFCQLYEITAKKGIANFDEIWFWFISSLILTSRKAPKIHQMDRDLMDFGVSWKCCSYLMVIRFIFTYLVGTNKKQQLNNTIISLFKISPIKQK